MKYYIRILIAVSAAILSATYASASSIPPVEEGSWQVITYHLQQMQQQEGYVQFIDSFPQYPGGEEGFHRFILENITYPEEAYLNLIEGTTVLEFTVTEQGEIDNIRVAESSHPLLDEEAVRVMKLSSGWKPGVSAGKPVAVEYLFPFEFTLE